ncbi:MAG: TonB-dependent receptor, partial [Bacteroidota bacterium]|nr:TonB-dependent receptor [Bacteroidota bacterium]MDX5431448.1 TonB-dependent receptor [Bacteroidota bacterium]MDX5470176.1 TonB-dependent receptor [Bacteroidota bacterium]
MRLVNLFICISLALAIPLEAAGVRGIVLDGVTKERLPYVNIYCEGTTVGTLSDDSGYFELPLSAPGNVVFSYVGYETLTLSFQGNEYVRVEMSQGSGIEMTEAQVKAKPLSSGIHSPNRIDSKTIQQLPGFAGEPDIIQAFMAQPGIKKAGEANGAMLVRGGGADQNLVLLDGIPVYQTGHLISFYSPFQTELIRDAELMKGYIPSVYGGRLSSVLAIRSNSISDSLSGSLGMGILMAKARLDVPLVRDRWKIQLGFRRSLPDLVWPIAGQSFPAKFFDGRLRSEWILQPNHTLTLSVFQSLDDLKAGGTEISKYRETENRLVPEMHAVEV